MSWFDNLRPRRPQNYNEDSENSESSDSPDSPPPGTPTGTSPQGLANLRAVADANRAGNLIAEAAEVLTPVANRAAATMVVPYDRAGGEDADDVYTKLTTYTNKFEKDDPKFYQQYYFFGWYKKEKLGPPTPTASVFCNLPQIAAGRDVE